MIVCVDVQIVQRKLPLLTHSRPPAVPTPLTLIARSASSSSSDHDMSDGPHTGTVIWRRRPDGSELRTDCIKAAPTE